MLFTVYYSTELVISGSGYMVYGDWTGNTIFAIVVITCNIRIITISHQFNIIQGVLCASGVILFYLSFLIVTAIIDTDSKSTLFQEMGTGVYWLNVLSS